MNGPGSRSGLTAMLITAIAGGGHAGEGTTSDALIDDRSSGSLRASHGGQWRLGTDQVMGGISTADLKPGRHGDRGWLRLSGTVSTANSGGFVQMALDPAGGKHWNASTFTGLQLLVSGNGEKYNVHLRTSDLRLPWQSYRAEFVTEPEWRVIRIPFSSFEAYRIKTRLDTSRLIRLGLVAIGRNFAADLCLGDLRFYRQAGKTQQRM